MHEQYTLAEIAARDGYLCALCGLTVDMAIASPLPDSPSIDHIFPISVSRDDTRSNVQLAHRRCNVAKGASLPDERPALAA
ncbi:HNH endonuclease [Streptomyces sp. NPDC101455]|uniref:HNH endonuclease n=1 Tax=Streptomyces sp. NPDC101455 TaxID=3366142 RepID=UPI0037F4AF52